MKKVLFFIVICLGIYVIPTLAVEPSKGWDFYGSARMMGASWSRGHWYREDVPGKVVNDSVPVKRAIWDMEYMSRFGAVCKSGNYGFRFEAGWSPVIKQVEIIKLGEDYQGVYKTRDGLLMRRLYGEWYISDKLSMLIGQDWNIANFFPSSQVFNMEEGLGYCGALFTGRRPQIRVTYEDKVDNFLKWNAQFATVKTDTFIVSTSQTPEAEEKMPKLEAGVMGEITTELLGLPCAAKLQLVAGMTKYELVNDRKTGAVKRRPVNSECLGGELGLTFWKFKLGFAYAQGENLGAYGVSMGDPEGYRSSADMKPFYPYFGFPNDSAAAQGNDPVLCSPFIRQGCLVLSCKPFNWIAAEVGGGLVDVEPSAVDLVSQYESAKVPNIFRRSAYYANLQFNLLDGHLLFIPEFSFSDFGGGIGTDIDGTGGKWYSSGFMLQFDM